MKAIRKAFLVTLGLAFFVAPPFLAAGRVDWFGGWLWLGTIMTGMALVRVHIARHNPDLPRRRSRIGKGTPAWDLVLVNLLRITIIAVVVVAGLDAGRFGWSPLPRVVQYTGVLVMAIGLVLTGLAMGENRHFEATVRIQDDESHSVIDTGPYSIMRHPGYAGMTLMILASALVLGSGWALVPALAAIVVVLTRTLLEDRFLRERLPGYRAYSQAVSYRLLPGLW